MMQHQQHQPRVRDAFPQVKSDRGVGGKGGTRTAEEARNAAEGAPGVSGAEEEMLRQFDLDLRFGPMLGLTRLERWERAEELGLRPPVAVRDVLVGRKPGDSVLSSLFEGRV